MLNHCGNMFFKFKKWVPDNNWVTVHQIHPVEAFCLPLHSVGKSEFESPSHLINVPWNTKAPCFVP